jgi:hypothetical protein
MNLDRVQEHLFATIKEASREAIAVSEGLGMSHAFAKLAEKVETVNLLLVPAMTTTGLVAGEVKDMYAGKGADSEKLKAYLADVMQSVILISAVFEIPLSEVMTIACKEKE